MSVVAGRVMPLPRGEWDSTTEYNILDIVSRNDSAYMATGTSTGIDPAGSSGSSYWMRIVPDMSDKADKVESATEGNFAGLDANGNLTDSGLSSTDVAASTLKPYTISVPINAWSLSSGKYYATVAPASGKVFSNDSLIFVALSESASDDVRDFASFSRLRPSGLSGGLLQLCADDEPDMIVPLNVAASLVVDAT